MTPQSTTDKSTAPRLHHPALRKAVGAMLHAMCQRILNGGEPLTTDEAVEILDGELFYTDIRAALDVIGRSVDATRRTVNDSNPTASYTYVVNR